MSGVAERLSKIRTENGPTIEFSNMVVTVNFENHRENGCSTGGKWGQNERVGGRNSKYFFFFNCARCYWGW